MQTVSLMTNFMRISAARGRRQDQDKRGPYLGRRLTGKQEEEGGRQRWGETQGREWEVETQTGA